MTEPTNPYAAGREEAEYGVPVYSVPLPGQYAAPSLESGSPYADTPTAGWAPSLRLSPVGVPDATRLGDEPIRDTVPHEGQQPEAFYRGIDADKFKRHSVEYQDADGFEENKAYPGYPSAAAGANRFARNPREIPPPEPRPTTRMAPRSYLFTRPFMTGLPKNIRPTLNGMHFSMAAHRRDYPILGMQPVQTRRTTYRIDPQPWDTGMVDMPPPQDNPTDIHEAPQTVEVAYSSRSWRLG